MKVAFNKSIDFEEPSNSIEVPYGDSKQLSEETRTAKTRRLSHIKKAAKKPSPRDVKNKPPRMISVGAYAKKFLWGAFAYFPTVEITWNTLDTALTAMSSISDNVDRYENEILNNTIGKLDFLNQQVVEDPSNIAIQQEYEIQSALHNETVNSIHAGSNEASPPMSDTEKAFYKYFFDKLMMDSFDKALNYEQYLSSNMYKFQVDSLSKSGEHIEELKEIIDGLQQDIADLEARLQAEIELGNARAEAFLNQIENTTKKLKELFNFSKQTHGTLERACKKMKKIPGVKRAKVVKSSCSAVGAFGEQLDQFNSTQNDDIRRRLSVEDNDSEDWINRWPKLSLWISKYEQLRTKLVNDVEDKLWRGEIEARDIDWTFLRSLNHHTFSWCERYNDCTIDGESLANATAVVEKNKRIASELSSELYNTISTTLTQANKGMGEKVLGERYNATMGMLDEIESLTNELEGHSDQVKQELKTSFDDIRQRMDETQWDNVNKTDYFKYAYTIYTVMFALIQLTRVCSGNGAPAILGNNPITNNRYDDVDASYERRLNASRALLTGDQPFENLGKRADEAVVAEELSCEDDIEKQEDNQNESARTNDDQFALSFSNRKNALLRSMYEELGGLIMDPSLWLIVFTRYANSVVKDMNDIMTEGQEDINNHYSVYQENSLTTIEAIYEAHTGIRIETGSIKSNMKEMDERYNAHQDQLANNITSVFNDFIHEHQEHSWLNEDFLNQDLSEGIVGQNRIQDIEDNFAAFQVVDQIYLDEYQLQEAESAIDQGHSALKDAKDESNSALNQTQPSVNNTQWPNNETLPPISSTFPPVNTTEPPLLGKAREEYSAGPPQINGSVTTQNLGPVTTTALMIGVLFAGRVARRFDAQTGKPNEQERNDLTRNKPDIIERIFPKYFEKQEVKNFAGILGEVYAFIQTQGRRIPTSLGGDNTKKAQ